MRFFDFIFGKKKEEMVKPSVKSTTQAQSSLNQDTSKSTNVGTSTSTLTIEPFVFNSNCHQRYEKGNEVMGLQVCGRTVSVEKNTNGCKGYKLSSGDGYIVKVFNDDLGKPNMSDKPMRVDSKTSEKIELRGFPIEAQTPFGWQEVDYRDYGLTVYYTGDKVSKCVLHMFDRNVDLEYRKEEESKDRYAEMIEKSTFNPFNLTTEPQFQNPNRLPNLRPVFIRELTSMLNNSMLRSIQSDQEIVKSYVFNLVESYYNNAGYVPKNTLDEILSEVYMALKEMNRESIFPSLDTLKYQMYFCFLNN